jgi:hypothetical protein
VRSQDHFDSVTLCSANSQKHVRVIHKGLERSNDTNLGDQEGGAESAVGSTNRPIVNTSSRKVKPSEIEISGGKSGSGSVNLVVPNKKGIETTQLISTLFSDQKSHCLIV